MKNITRFRHTTFGGGRSCSPARRLFVPSWATQKAISSHLTRLQWMGEVRWNTHAS